MKKIHFKIIITFAFFLGIYLPSIGQEEIGKVKAGEKMLIPMESASMLDIEIMGSKEDFIDIKYQSSLAVDINADVYDNSGSVVHKLEYTVQEGDNERKHKLPNLKPGKYFISIFYGNQNKTYKFNIE
jgi:hypothetical protein